LGIKYVPLVFCSCASENVSGGVYTCSQQTFPAPLRPCPGARQALLSGSVPAPASEPSDFPSFRRTPFWALVSCAI
jgi:hypothetical protein